MKKKFTRSLLLNKKSVAKLDGQTQRSVKGGNNSDNTYCETCEPGCIPDTVEPSCDGSCWYSDCHCGNGGSGDWSHNWGDCS